MTSFVTAIVVLMMFSSKKRCSLSLHHEDDFVNHNGSGFMLRLLRLLFALVTRFCCSRSDLLLKNLALRQQLAVLITKLEAMTSDDL